MIQTLIILLLCVLAEGFFSGSEIALVNANRNKLVLRAEKGEYGAKQALAFLDQPEMMLGTTLVGTNLFTVTATVTATYFMINNFGQSGEFFAILLVWPMTFFIGEIMPKTIFQANADRIVPYCAIPLKFFMVMLYPAIWLFTRFSNLLIQTIKKSSGREAMVTRGDVKALAFGDRKSEDIEPDERLMIGRMIDFASTKVSEVMVPLIDVSALNFKMTTGEAAKFTAASPFSRFPVFKERIDEIVGIVDTYSLLDISTHSASLRKVMKKPVFVPESMSINALLAQLRHSGQEMAIVVDEYGGAVGIATLEDVLEEIVGDIEDEFDHPESFYRKIGPDSYIMQARAEVDFLNEKFKFRIPEGEYETLGGFLLERFDRIPRHGEQVREGKLLMTVLNPTNKNVTEVRIDVISETEIPPLD